MLLALRPPTRSARVLPSVGKPSSPALSVVGVPKVPVRGGEVARQFFVPTTPTFSRYPDIHAGFIYPSIVTTNNAPKKTGTAAADARLGGYASQMDFGIRFPAPSAGPRSNGLLLALPLSPITRILRQAETYLQERGFAIVWAAPSGFPTQFAGLQYYKGAVYELCLVALADAPAGAQWRVQKGGTTYAVYLVDTADSNASPVRLQTPAGIKAARFKT